MTELELVSWHTCVARFDGDHACAKRLKPRTGESDYLSAGGMGNKRVATCLAKKLHNWTCGNCVNYQDLALPQHAIAVEFTPDRSVADPTI